MDMNFKNWFNKESKISEITVSSGVTGGPGDIATFAKPIGLIRKDMYATIPRKRRRRPARRRYFEQQKQEKN